LNLKLHSVMTTCSKLTGNSLNHT